jgi:hypothetical protein
MSVSVNAKRALAAAAGCGLLLGGAPAGAQTPSPDLFATFKSVCADNGGVYARTIAAPAIQGWSKLPFPIPLPIKDAKLTRKTIRVKKSGETMGMFFAGDGELKSAGRSAPFQMCAVAIEPAVFETTVQKAQAMVGQPAVAGENGMRSFRYHQTADGKRTALGAGELKVIAPKLGPGTLVSVDVAPNKKLTVISYSIIQL